MCLELGRTGAATWFHPSVNPSIHPFWGLLYAIFANVKWRYSIIFFIPLPKGHYGVNLFFVIASGSQDLTAISVLQLYNPALFKWRLFAKCCYVLLNPHVFGSTWLDRGAGWDTATKKQSPIQTRTEIKLELDLNQFQLISVFDFQN